MKCPCAGFSSVLIRHLSGFSPRIGKYQPLFFVWRHFCDIMLPVLTNRIKVVDLGPGADGSCDSYKLYFFHC